MSRRPTLSPNSEFRLHCDAAALTVFPASGGDSFSLGCGQFVFTPGNLGRRSYMSIRRSALVVLAVLLTASLPGRAQDWGQWGRNAQHVGTTNAVGQEANQMLEDIIYDPFVSAETSDPNAAPNLLVHYQVPLLDGNSVYMEFKSGTYTDITHWETQIWNEKRLDWNHGHLSETWSFQSDWKPVPYGSFVTGNGPGWEPVFHAALNGDNIYIPGASGSVFKVSKSSGHQLARIAPFGTDPHTFLTGPITVDSNGNVYYNVQRLDPTTPWDVDIVNSWLVKVSPNNSFRTATYASLTPGAPAGTDQCLGVFDTSQLPWPPRPNAVPPTVQCGSATAATKQR